MRDLEQREKRVNNVQVTGDKLLKDGHPARKTIEVQHFIFNHLFMCFPLACLVGDTDLTPLTLSDKNKT